MVLLKGRGKRSEAKRAPSGPQDFRPSRAARGGLRNFLLRPIKSRSLRKTHTTAASNAWRMARGKAPLVLRPHVFRHRESGRRSGTDGGVLARRDGPTGNAS